MVSFTSCDKDDPIVPNEEELITTVKYTLSPEGDASPNSKIVLHFQDLDGDGGKAPIVTGGTLKANTVYLGSLELLNELETPVENISLEVLEEDEDHQFFFESNLTGLSVAYADMDENKNPVGLQTKLITTTSGLGTLKISLRHQPNKAAKGVADGDITLAGGETDIEITFNIDVK